MLHSLAFEPVRLFTHPDHRKRDSEGRKPIKGARPIFLMKSEKEDRGIKA
jgi:hypothetical protein